MADKRFTNNDLRNALIALGGSVVLVAALHGVDFAATKITSAMKTANLEPAGEFTPGTYEAEAMGIGTVKATLTFNETNLTDVVLDTSNETPDIGGVATETLKNSLMEAQSTDFDAVAGATVTTDAVKEAAQKCFNQAAGIEEEVEAVEEVAEATEEAAEAAVAAALVPGEYTASATGMGDVKVTLTIGEDGTITDADLDVSAETPEIGGVAADTLKASLLEAQGTGFDGVAGATLTSNAVKAAVEDILAQAAQGSEEVSEAVLATGALVPGEYTATAMGMGNVNVTLTIGEDGTITDAALDVAAETPEIGGAAAETLKANLLAAQGAEFDGVAGATITSDAVKTAVADILSQASAGGEAEASEAVEAALTAGEYTASATGMGDVKVTLTIGEDGTITDAVLDVSSETPEIGGVAADTLKASLLEAQGSDFDGVAGATLTSNAVKAAVDDILAQAAASEAVEELAEAASVAKEYTASATGMGDVKVTLTIDEDGTITDAVLDVSSETPEIGGVAADTLKASLLEAQGSDFDGVAGATLTSNAVKAAVDDILAQVSAGASETAAEGTESAAALTAGEYTASATGMGDVKVTLTIGEDGTITDAVLDVSAETPEIGGAAADTLKASLLEAQGAEFDGVAGATLTSDAVKAAVADILAQAAM